jgi:hypothetical protein
LDDALRLETINAYSSLGDFTEARERLAQFYSKGKGKETEKTSNRLRADANNAPRR